MIAMKKIKLEYVSSITFSPIAKEIKKKTNLEIEIVANDIFQHIQRLSRSDLTNSTDVLIVHLTKDMFLEGWSNGGEKTSGDHVITLLDQFLQKNGLIWVIINTIDTEANNELVGLDKARLIAYLHEINFRLASLVLKHKQLRIVDATSCLARIGINNSISVKNELVMRLPYRAEAIDKLSNEYVQILEQIYFPRKKVIVVDADNTLWGGILGEDGLTGIKIDPSDYPGSAYWLFQEQLKKAKNSGLILAMVSKNNDEDIAEAFNHLNMPLRLDDFTIRRVNWQDKASNIQNISTQLNLGLDSFIFIDDNIFEIEQVRHAIPGIECYQFEYDNPEKGVSLLDNIPYLSSWEISAEDAKKTELYAQEVMRNETKVNSGSLEEYLKSLQLKLEYGINRQQQILRIAQLTNKTNQFNLTTRRYSESDIQSLMDNHRVYDFRVVDRYGDMGIVGVCIVKEGNIDSFLMSCRALGREVESTMLKIVCENEMPNVLTAEYIRTNKNQMVSHFYEMNGFIMVSQNDDYKYYRNETKPTPKFTIEIAEVH